VAAVRDFTRLYPSESQGIIGLRSTAPAFPKLAGVSVPELSVSPPQSFYFAPDAQPAPQTGKLEGGQVVAKAGRDDPGFLRFGPYVRLKRGAYLATFSLAAAGVRPDEVAAIMQVVGGGTVFASRPLTRRHLPSLPNLSNIEMSFATPGGLPVETRVYYRGKGTLRAGPISVQAIAPPQAEVHFHDWPIAFLWVAGTFLVGWLFVQVMLLSRQRKPNERHSAGA
jgi:hypothetical protein